MDQIKSDVKVIDIKREPIDWNQFNKIHRRIRPKKESIFQQISEYLKNRWKWFSMLSSLKSKLPIIQWLPKYNLRTDLLADIIAGVTISMLHIPHGISNSFILKIDPIHGLYVSLFPTLIYILLGTSRHISIGAFSVASAMMADTLIRIDAVPNRLANATSDWPPTYMEVLTALSIVTGSIQIIMGFLSLGLLSIILSDELVTSFTTGVVFHVLVSQLETLLGIHVPKQLSGPLHLIRSLEAIRKDIHKSNIVTVILSSIVIAIIVLFRKYLEPVFKSKTSVPLPSDLLIVIISTVISWLTQFNKTFDIQIVGTVNDGLPVPSIPRIDFIPTIFVDCLVLAAVTFGFSYTLAKMSAKRNRYELDANQELIALGSANVFSSFFSAFPSSAALSRSTVQETMGGKTQIAGLFSCLVILLVLLVMAPLLYHLPKFVLSSIITVSVISMFKHFKDFWEFWFISKLNATVWMSTFLGVVFLDIETGLILGLILSLNVILIRIIMPNSSVLGRIPSTELYVDINKFGTAQQITGIQIFRFCSPIFYLTKDVFKQKVLDLSSFQNIDRTDSESHKHQIKPNKIIIDMSCIPFIDSSGVETIVDLFESLEQNNIGLALAACPLHIIELFEKTGFFKKLNKCCIYPTIHDAVITFS